MRLLFTVAHWHGLSKLRLHTDLTLDILDKLTASFGKELRDFKQNTCSAFTTWELPKEVNARNRRQARQAQAHLIGQPAALSAGISVEMEDKTVGGQTTQPGVDKENTKKRGQSRTVETNKRRRAETGENPRLVAKINTGRQLKEFNINTYKHHALGDVVATIRRYGTTDSYSTETVSFIF